MCSVILCGSFPFLPRLYTYIRDPASRKASRLTPGPDTPDAVRGTPPTPKLVSWRSKSDVTQSTVELTHELPQVKPAWKAAGNRREADSPV